jgi:hypothetical protein
VIRCLSVLNYSYYVSSAVKVQAIIRQARAFMEISDVRKIRLRLQFATPNTSLSRRTVCTSILFCHWSPLCHAHMSPHLTCATGWTT